MHLLDFILYAVIAFGSAAAEDTRTEFHIGLTPEERHHYFGTENVSDVPEYNFINRPETVNQESNGGLELLVEAFGTSIHLILHRNRQLISPGCLVEREGTNGTRHVTPCNSEHLGCFYTGIVSNDNQSSVSANVCDGFHGVIRSNSTAMVVQPVSPGHVTRARRDTRFREPHIVHLLSATNFNDNIDTGVQQIHTPLRRRRQAAANTERYIETILVVDPRSQHFHGNDTEMAIKTFFNIAAERFLDPSLGVRIHMTLTKLIILSEDEVEFTLNEQASETLDSFCEWQKDWNVPGAKDSADYVALIAKINFSYQGASSVAGLARKGMCNPSLSCSINEDQGLFTGLILSHETGHVLTMSHDGEGNECETGKYVMSATGAGGRLAQTWSTCSAKYVEEYLSTSKAECLLNVPEVIPGFEAEGQPLPGSRYNADDQCQLSFTPEWKYYIQPGTTVRDCSQLRCLHPDGTHIISLTYPVMDGTDCALTPDTRKWCLQGSCVDMAPGTTDPVDGGWSQWGAFTLCSRTCGAGVQVRSRSCDKPEPMYGGSQCPGEKVMVEICNVHPCETSQRDFQQEQCAETNGRPFMGKLHSWNVPMIQVKGHGGCKRSCQSGESISPRGTSIDGTNCINLETPGATLMKCVHGECMSFGCDGHSQSRLQQDRCGVCNGRNDTCERRTGTAKSGEPQAFKTFLTVPAGSTMIRIDQANRFCYLGVVMRGERLFPTDDDRRLSGTLDVSGVTIKYQRLPERLEIMGPLPEPIALQVYMKYGLPYQGIDPDIEYEYSVPIAHNNPEYMWKTRAGPCSVTCGSGSQRHIITCVDEEDGEVEDYHCDLSQKPCERLEECRLPECPPQWIVGDWTECSKTCGGGQRSRTVACVKVGGDTEQVVSDDECSGLTRPEDHRTCNEDPCPGTWRALQWSECSSTCGRGERSRQVFCYNDQQEQVDVSKCISQDKPEVLEYCMKGPCDTTVTGDACKDDISDCFGLYGDDICTGNYKSWAHRNCMKSCGICVSETHVEESCRDETDRCPSLIAGFCGMSQYKEWAERNCHKFCGHCECADKRADCAAYGNQICSKFVQWAHVNCQSFCGFCGDGYRFKREASYPDTLPELDVIQQEETVLDTLPEVGDDIPLVDPSSDGSPPSENEESVPSEESELPGESVPPMESVPPEVESSQDVPERPICNTVNTELSGRLEVTGHLEAGERCRQVIALPLQYRVLLRFKSLDFDCSQGDELYIIDGINGQRIHVCSFLPEKEWLSSGSIVHLTFTPAHQGHGFSLMYETYPSNITVPACSKLLTSVKGSIPHHGSDVTSQQDVTSEEVCEIYITGTPGTMIELKLSLDLGDGSICDDNNSVIIEDLEEAGKELFCGVRKPFIWESSGSNIRLRYKNDVKGTFKASYRQRG